MVIQCLCAYSCQTIRNICMMKYNLRVIVVKLFNNKWHKPH